MSDYQESIDSHNKPQKPISLSSPNKAFILLSKKRLLNDSVTQTHTKYFSGSKLESPAFPRIEF